MKLLLFTEMRKKCFLMVSGHCGNCVYFIIAYTVMDTLIPFLNPMTTVWPDLIWKTGDP